MLANLFTTNAASNWYAVLFDVVVLIWLLSEVVGGIIIPSLRRGKDRVQQRQRKLNSVTWVEWACVFVVSLYFGAFGIALLPNWAYFVGIVAMLAGVGFRQWSVAVLGRYFSLVIGVQEKQRVIQSGPYCVIRHPSYTGLLLIQVGVALALQSWAAVLVVVTIFGLVYGHRMLSEEKFLVKELGDNYVEYMKHTKRIIPFLI